MHKIRETFCWYPPAEAKIPWPSLIHSFLPGTSDLEMDLQSYLHTEACVLGISARGLLSRLLMTLNRSRDSSRRNLVLIPGYTCYSVAASVVRAGLTIACYDLNPVTFEPDMESVHAMTDKNTLAIIGQHLFGIPADLEGIARHAKQNGSFFIENAAQGFGGAWRGKQLGTQGDFGIISFGRGKSLPLGSGGAVIGDSNVLKDLGMERTGPGYLDLFKAVATQVLSDRRIYGILEAMPLGLGKTIFDPGFSICTMPYAMRRLGKYSLRSLSFLNEHRGTIAGIYNNVLEGRDIVALPPESRAVFTRFPVFAGIKPIPKELIRLGVRRMYPKAILDEPSIQPFCIRNNTPTLGSSRIAETLITLPTHTGISPQNAAEIAEGIKEIYL